MDEITYAQFSNLTRSALTIMLRQLNQGQVVILLDGGTASLADDVKAVQEFKSQINKCCQIIDMDNVDQLK